MPLTEDFKKELVGDVMTRCIKPFCKRCGDNMHNVFKCWVALEKSWTKGVSSVLDAKHAIGGTFEENRDEAEKLFQDSLKELEKIIPVEEAEEKARRKSEKAARKKQIQDKLEAAGLTTSNSTSTQPATITPASHQITLSAKAAGKQRASTLSDQPYGSTSSGSTQKPREAENTKDVGKFIYTKDNTQPTGAPQVPNNGVCTATTSHLGPPAVKPKIEIISNYVRVLEIPQRLHHYSLSFSRTNAGSTKGPIQIDKRSEVIAAFNALLTADVLELRKHDQKKWATDYRDIWCSDPLRVFPAELEQWQSPEFEFTQLNGKKVTDLRVTLSSQPTTSNISQDLTTGHVANLEDKIRALNAHVAKGVRHSNDSTHRPVLQVGANKVFLKKGFTEMKDRNGNSLGLRAVRGYYTSIRPARGQVLLNVNTATSAFLSPMLVSELLDLVGDQKYVERMLKGKYVRIAYRRQNYEGSGIDVNDELPRTKVFQQFGLAASDQKFFKMLEKDENDAKADRLTDLSDPGRTVLEYFGHEVHVEELGQSYNEQLCVNVGKRLRSINSDLVTEEDMRRHTTNGAQWIPACLLEILPDQPMTVPMSGDHTTAMIDQALRYPAANVGLIEQEGLHVLGARVPNQQGSSQHLRDLGLRLDRNLISFAAFTIPPPGLTHLGPANSLTTTTVNPDYASWNIQDSQFVKPGIINNVHVLGLAGWKPGWAFEGFVENYRRTREKDIQQLMIHQLGHHGITSNQDNNVYGGPQYGEYDEVGCFQDHMWQCRNKEKDFSLILLKSKDYQIYAGIKRLADLEYGHPTVFIVGKKLCLRESAKDRDRNGRLQTLSNLALKINMKIGGTNHWLEDTNLTAAFTSGNQRNTTIILGADVTHPPAGSKPGCPSIACVVGSVDQKFMKYLGSMRLQAGGQEQIEKAHMRSMVKERIQAWKSENKGTPPANILVYRDGVSDSQLKTISETESEQIELAWQDAGGQGKPNITFIIVGKRHHTRFYAKDRNQTFTSSEAIKGADGKTIRTNRFANGNLKPGLLVDDVVTNPSYDNFFLQSHCAIKGTARSAHYHILRKDMNLSLDKLQKLTMQLCYTFGRSTTGVSYAAPAYMADRLCERGRAYLRHWWDDIFLEPTFNMPEYYHNNGDKRKPTKDEVLAEKRAFALEVSRHKGLWGKFDDQNPDPSRRRLNPWHENFDDKMFWM